MVQSESIHFRKISSSKNDILPDIKKRLKIVLKLGKKTRTWKHKRLSGRTVVFFVCKNTKISAKTMFSTLNVKNFIIAGPLSWPRTFHA